MILVLQWFSKKSGWSCKRKVLEKSSTSTVCFICPKNAAHIEVAREASVTCPSRSGTRNISEMVRANPPGWKDMTRHKSEHSASHHSSTTCMPFPQQQWHRTHTSQNKGALEGRWDAYNTWRCHSSDKDPMTGSGTKRHWQDMQQGEGGGTDWLVHPDLCSCCHDPEL